MTTIDYAELRRLALTILDAPNIFGGIPASVALGLVAVLNELDHLRAEADPDIPTIAYMAGAHDYKRRAEAAEARCTHLQRELDSANKGCMALSQLLLGVAMPTPADQTKDATEVSNAAG